MLKLLGVGLVLAVAGSAHAEPAVRVDESSEVIGFVGGGRLGGGGAVRLPCISEAEKAAVNAQTEAFFQTDAGREFAAGRGFDVLPFKFFPQAGNLYGDLHHNNYFDLQIGSGILDFECTNHTYDGHRGHDVGPRSFDEQEIGIPVYAVGDGVVTAAQDGHFDRQVEWDPSNQANYVVVTHGQGLETWYWHLKNGSVLPAIGQSVRAGEQIGLMASSGFSTGPHLHFEASQNGVSFEPSVGACQPVTGGWEVPWSIRRDLYVREYQFVRGDLADQFNFPPYEYPRDNHATFDTEKISYVLQGQNMPKGSTFTLRWYRPNGQLDFETGPWPISWSTQDHRWWWMYWTYTYPRMRTISGEWTFQVFFNGVLHVDAPIRVFSAEQAGANRAPREVDPVFDPVAPEPGQVVFCRISPDLIHDDPDYDVVRYTYRWLVNGEERRVVTSAAHSDALTAGSFVYGDTVVCEVTPSDGELSAEMRSVSAAIGIGCRADLSGDLRVGMVDVLVLVSAWGEGGVDLNDDGVTDSIDLAILLAAWGDCG